MKALLDTTLSKQRLIHLNVHDKEARLEIELDHKGAISEYCLGLASMRSQDQELSIPAQEVPCGHH
jgi:hypothetical protein